MTDPVSPDVTPDTETDLCREFIETGNCDHTDAEHDAIAGAALTPDTEPADPYDEPVFVQGHNHSEPVCAWPDCETYLTPAQMAERRAGALTPDTETDLCREFIETGNCDHTDAEHDAIAGAALTPDTETECTCESMGGRFGAHRDDCPQGIAWKALATTEEQGQADRTRKEQP